MDLAFRRLLNNTCLEARLGYDQVRNKGSIKTFPEGEYKSQQKSDAITGYIGYEVRGEDSLWFDRVRTYGSFRLRVGKDEKKEKWVDSLGKEWPLNGNTSNETMFTLGVDGSIYRLTNKVSLAGGVELSHYRENSKTGLTINPIGADFYNARGVLFGGVRVGSTWWSDGDFSIGLNCLIGVN